MDAPKCGTCGKVEWRHICSGTAGKPEKQVKPAARVKTELPGRPRSVDRNVIGTPAPAVTRGVTHTVTHKPAVTHKRTNAMRQKDYRERMAAKRAG